MWGIQGSLALAYTAGSGVATNAAVVGRGLFRAGRRLAEGRLGEAGVEALAALAAPALLSYASAAALVMEVVHGAQELAAPALEAAAACRIFQDAA